MGSVIGGLPDHAGCRGGNTELGHATVGSLLGLEIGGISIGYGKLIWTCRIRNIPVRVHLAPAGAPGYN